jgi:hypothetical protein
MNPNEILSKLELWDKGTDIPPLIANDDRLKNYFLLNYVDGPLEELVSIWNSQNFYLQWKIFILFDIYEFYEQLDDNGYLRDMTVLQLIDKKEFRPWLSYEERIYINDLIQNPIQAFVTISNHFLPILEWRKLSILQKRRFLPSSIVPNLTFLEYKLLISGDYSFKANEFQEITNPLGIYLVLSKFNDFWQYVDFEKYPWAVVFIPRSFAWLVLIQNTSNFAHNVALIKNKRANGWFDDNFHTYDQIQTHISFGNYFIRIKYYTSEYYKINYPKFLEEQKKSPFIFKDLFTTPQTFTRAAPRAVPKPTAPSKPRARTYEIPEPSEEEVQEGINKRQKLVAENELRRIQHQYQEALKSGIEKSEFGQATRYFGLPPNFTCDELKRAYRKKSLAEHPDRGGTAEAFQRLTHYEHLLSYICKKT